MATSNITSSVVQNLCRSSLAGARERLSFNLGARLLCAAAPITARVSVEVKTSITQTDLALAFEATSTSHCQMQQNRSFQVLTAALILSEDSLSASFTEKHSKASSRECADTTLRLPFKVQHRLTVLQPTLRMLFHRHRHNTNLQL